MKTQCQNIELQNENNKLTRKKTESERKTQYLKLRATATQSQINLHISNKQRKLKQLPHFNYKCIIIDK